MKKYSEFSISTYALPELSKYLTVLYPEVYDRRVEIFVHSIANYVDQFHVQKPDEGDNSNRKLLKIAILVTL